PTSLAFSLTTRRTASGSRVTGSPAMVRNAIVLVPRSRAIERSRTPRRTIQARGDRHAGIRGSAGTGAGAGGAGGALGRDASGRSEPAWEAASLTPGTGVVPFRAPPRWSIAPRGSPGVAPP